MVPTDARAGRGRVLGAVRLALWMVVGALAGVGIVGLPTVGRYLLLAAAAIGVLALLVPRVRPASPTALVLGLAAAPLYLAWLNRSGPGSVCEADGSAATCVDTWSPWPFIGVAVVLLGAGTVLVRREPRSSSAPG